MSTSKKFMAACLLLSFAAVGAGFGRAAQAPKDLARIYGRVTDFRGLPVEGATVELKDARFQDAAAATTDKSGGYSLSVPKGTYMALTAVKDYQVKSLEYWAWSVPAERDIEINPRFDKLEIYAINAWRPQGGLRSYQIYFRPMSLSRVIAKAGEAGGLDNFKKLPVIDIAPDLAARDMKVTIDGQEVKILEVNKIREAAGPDQLIFGYVIQVPFPEKTAGKDYLTFTIMATDPATGDKGEGCLFFKAPKLI